MSTSEKSAEAPAPTKPLSPSSFSNELAKELNRLRALPIRDLQATFVEVWGAPTNSRNRDYLIKRIAWRIQEKAKGGLSERAKQRLEEVLDDCAIRIRPPRDFLKTVEKPLVIQTSRKTNRGRSGVTQLGIQVQSAPLRDLRLPPVGSELRRIYRGQEIVVRVLDQGFLYGSMFHPSLSAIAREVTGQNWNGFLFFGLTDRKVKA